VEDKKQPPVTTRPAASLPCTAAAALRCSALRCAAVAPRCALLRTAVPRAARCTAMVKGTEVEDKVQPTGTTSPAAAAVHCCCCAALRTAVHCCTAPTCRATVPCTAAHKTANQCVKQNRQKPRARQAPYSAIEHNAPLVQCCTAAQTQRCATKR